MLAEPASATLALRVTNPLLFVQLHGMPPQSCSKPGFGGVAASATAGVPPTTTRRTPKQSRSRRPIRISNPFRIPLRRSDPIGDTQTKAVISLRRVIQSPSPSARPLARPQSPPTVKPPPAPSTGAGGYHRSLPSTTLSNSPGPARHAALRARLRLPHDRFEAVGTSGSCLYLSGSS